MSVFSETEVTFVFTVAHRSAIGEKTISELFSKALTEEMQRVARENRMAENGSRTTLNRTPG